MSAKHHLGIADYAIVLSSLAISSFIGIGFRFTGNRQKTTNEYLLAGKNSNMLPVIMSTSVTVISGITLLGLPAEIYRYGAQYAVTGVSYGIGMLLASRLFIPVYFKCKVTSIYEFLEMRYGKYTRYTIAGMFVVQMLLYMSVVLLAPVLALSAVTDFSLEMAIILCGSVCTFYSCIGGLKAVLWADVFQSILVFSSIGTIICMGVYEMGGIGEIYKRTSAGNRLEFFDLRFDFTIRYTFWNCISRGLCLSLGFYGINQIEVQRALSMSGCKRAQSALQWSTIPVFILTTSVCLFGLVLYSLFYLCDPVLMQEKTGISKYDQLVPYFIITRLNSFPGLTGLCIAGLFGGSLSTLSSALNSVSTVVVIDFLKPKFGKKLTDKSLVFIAKGISLVFGVICILLTFAVSSIDSLMQAGSVFVSLVDGPVLAIFLIGVLTRKVSDKSAVIGLFVSLIVVGCVGFGSMGYRSQSLPLETSGCATTLNATLTFPNSTIITSQDIPREVFFLYKISFLWIPSFGCVLTLGTVFLTSFIKDGNTNMIPTDSKCLSPITRYWMKPDNHHHQQGKIEEFSL